MAPHARRADEGEVDERLEQRPERAEQPATPTRQALLLHLQRGAGNQAVQRMLAPGARLIQRVGDPGFTFGGSGVVVETLTTQDELDDAVESLIEENLNGHGALFTRNSVATSAAEWRDLVLGLLGEHYTLDGLGAPQVLISIRAVKDKYREEALRHFAQVHVYWNQQDDGPPWSVAELRRRMVAAGAYLEAADDDVLDALFESGGEFARTQVEFDAAKNIQLLDEDNVVVLIDDHQQKHQRDKIAEFPAYTGEPGSKFAPGKGLEWHRTTTALAVKATVLAAVEQHLVTTTKDFAPSKTPKNGIVYDLLISYDPPTGKWVGSYHCNPLRDET